MIYTLFHYLFMRRICREKFDGAQPYQANIYFGITAVFMTAGFIFLFSYRCNLLRYGMILVLSLSLFCFRKQIAAALRYMISVKKEL